VEQDRSAWDGRLLAEGLSLFEQSAKGRELTAYHVEAAIAATHASARSVEETDWPAIASLYEKLMEIAPSPVVALNRAIAIGQTEGDERGLEALHAIADRDRLDRYPFYPAAIGEFELRLGRYESAERHFRNAMGVARSATERRFLERRLQSCNNTRYEAS
jgi:RNA polymerase sigma-70 factor (ECF subfamily)